MAETGHKKKDVNYGGLKCEVVGKLEVLKNFVVALT